MIRGNQNQNFLILSEFPLDCREITHMMNFLLSLLRKFRWSFPSRCREFLELAVLFVHFVMTRPNARKRNFSFRFRLMKFRHSRGKFLRINEVEPRSNCALTRSWLIQIVCVFVSSFQFLPVVFSNGWKSSHHF